MRQARLPSHGFDLLVDLQCDNGGGSARGGCQEKSSSHFFPYGVAATQMSGSLDHQQNKNTTLHAEGILGLEGRERKKQREQGLAAAATIASIHQSLPRRNFTARHGRWTLRAIPGAACHPAPSRPGYTLQCEFGKRGAEADFFANIGKEAAVSQPLVTSASFPSSAKEQANYCRVHISIQ